MSSVWLVTHGDWEGMTVLGIYDSEDKANALVEKFYDNNPCVDVIERQMNTPEVDSDARVPWEVCFYKRTGNVRLYNARVVYPFTGGVATSIPEVDASDMAATGATIVPVSSDSQFIHIYVWARTGREAVLLATDKFNQVMRGLRIVNSSLAVKESDNDIN